MFLHDADTLKIRFKSDRGMQKEREGVNQRQGRERRGDGGGLIQQLTPRHSWWSHTPANNNMTTSAPPAFSPLSGTQAVRLHLTCSFSHWAPDPSSGHCSAGGLIHSDLQ